MNRTRRAVALAATLGLLGAGSIAGSAQAATPVDAISEGLTPVTLLNFNDFHGRIDDGLALTGVLGKNFACTIQTARATYGAEQTVLLSAGDNVGASSFASNILGDLPTLEYLNALGVTASAVGNHEFDRGFPWLQGEAIPAAGFQYLGANVYERGTTTPALEEYRLTEVNGVMLGIIGAVTDETPSLVGPDGISSIEFGDPVAAVNRVAAQLSDGNALNGEADVLIAEYHDGAAVATSLGAAEDATEIFDRIVNDTSPAVDVVFNGHTHLAYQWDGPVESGTRVISQSASYGARLGVVQLGYNAETGEVEEYIASQLATAPVTPACEADPTYAAAAEIVDEAVANAKEIGTQPVAEISADITTAYGDAQVVQGVYWGTTRDDRLRESALGNLAANAWAWAANQPGRTGADIGIMNPGGLRADLLFDPSDAEGDGVVTYAEAAAVNPFANTLQSIDVTGAVFRQVLEQQWQPAASSRPFLKLGLSDNVRYTYDPDAAAGSRILDVWVDGAPLDEAATYTVAAGSFLIGGGDNFTALQQGTQVRDLGLIDMDAFINYLAAQDVVEPSFEKNGVAVTDGALPVARGEQATVRVDGVDLTSLGAPANTEFDVVVDGFTIGTAAITTARTPGVPTRDGAATVTLTVNPAYVADTVQLVAKPSGTVVTLPLAALPTASFSDVTPATQFHDEIAWLGGAGIAQGWPDGTFRPVTAIHRDAMAAFLYRLAGSPEFPVPAESPFSDVPTTHQFYKEIAWLSQREIANGWSDGTFRPDLSIGRDAMAAFLHRAAGSPAYTPPATSPFSDVTVDSEFYTEIAWLHSTGITTGWPDGTFRPTDPVNRDAMAAFLHRYVAEFGVPELG
ncbi:5'-nucleotidase C-terminal domain-containing protein [Propioniciclava soli]|uniref:5'-nucleotidase C-terminal domain-containing protein n=1 Tax=Propioniciclava soli TaxID=2775081 RepID=A0ABZ3C9B0_9ACTN|nr:5'-nucleotidase C-terminal domain-containing protein [Propioniciclava soli]